VECELTDASRGILKVTNRHATRSLTDYTVTLKILENGLEILTKQIPSLPLAAGKDTLVNIQTFLPKQKAAKEYLMTVSFSLKNDMPWAKASHVVASNQFALSGLPANNVVSSSGGKLAIQQMDNQVTVNGKGFRLVFDNKNGALSSYASGEKELIVHPLLPDFTRPLTDNDRRGWKAQVKLKEWYETKPDLKDFTIQIEPSGEVKARSMYRLMGIKAIAIVTYLVNGDGVVKVDVQLNADSRLPDIPKVGMTCGIAGDLRRISWYGRGPLENYIDRRTGFNVEIYSLPITEFMEPYIVPQENGNRTDVRWMLLSNPARQGLLVVADSLLSMSAWPYAKEEFNRVKHLHEMKEANFVTLNIDLVQMGVGGNDSWSDVAAPLEKYRIKAGKYAYRFFLCPVKMGLDQVAKNWEKLKF
jgi:beta-galactosidase